MNQPLARPPQWSGMPSQSDSSWPGSGQVNRTPSKTQYPWHMGKPSGWLKPKALVLAVLGATLATPENVAASQLDVGPDWQVRFDNSIKASAIYRLEDADPRLVDGLEFSGGTPSPQALNFNAGDDNFRKSGIVSRRLDLFSEFDVVYKEQYGLRLSGAAWYDAEYQDGKTDAEDATNQQTPMNEFTDETKKVAGKDAELMDAFVFGGWDVGEEGRLTMRLGRHALQWGESLFFGDNGIARAQGPIDIYKLQSSPTAEFKEFIRPVNQFSFQYDLTWDLSISGYYQLEWEEDRLSPAGTFFSTANVTWGSDYNEFLNLDGDRYLLAPGSTEEPSDSGQFGLQLKLLLGSVDLGFYLARYHAKDGQLYSQFDVGTFTGGPNGTGRWWYKFPENITTTGLSASTTLGSWNLAAEASVRNNNPLRSKNMIHPNVAPQPRLVKGRTAHANLSWLASFGPSLVSQESVFVGEIAWNKVMSKDDPDHTLDHVVTDSATQLQLVYTPTWRQALAGLDVNMPVGLRYGLQGNSAAMVSNPEGVGTATLGLTGTYLSVWNMALNYTHYLGKSEPFLDYGPLKTGGDPEYTDGNPLADRNHITLTLGRTF